MIKTANKNSNNNATTTVTTAPTITSTCFLLYLERNAIWRPKEKRQAKKDVCIA